MLLRVQGMGMGVSFFHLCVVVSLCSTVFAYLASFPLFISTDTILRLPGTEEHLWSSSVCRDGLDRAPGTGTRQCCLPPFLKFIQYFSRHSPPTIHVLRQASGQGQGQA